jgi:hypothetical protein
VLERITDHVARGLALLPQQFRTTNTQAFLTTLLEEFQEVEDALWQLLDATLLTATGARLTQYGKLLGEPRLELDDDALRKVLLARVVVNRSCGLDRDIAAMLAVFADAFTIVDTPPAALLVTLDAFPGDGLPARIGGLLRRVVAGGVGAQAVIPADASPTFHFASGEDIETDADRGFGDTTQTTGGHLAGAYG